MERLEKFKEFERGFYPLLRKKNSEKIGKRLANAPRDIEFEEFFLKGSPKKIAEYLARAPEETYQFIDEAYVSKQLEKRQMKIYNHLDTIKTYELFDGKSSEEAAKILEEAPMDIYKFMNEVYVKKQPIKRKKEINKYLARYIVNAWREDEDNLKKS